MEMREPMLNGMMKRHMDYMTDRQEVLAHNLANIDTPGYKARELEKVDFNAMAQRSLNKLSVRITSPQHQQGTKPSTSDYRTERDRATFETTPTQNNVVLEDQMAKVNETNAQFQLSSSLFRKYTQLYRKAAGSNQ